MNNSFRALPFVLCLLQTFAARAVTFTSDATIDFTNHNYDGADIVVTNCAVTINGTHSFASLQVLSGGKLNHTASDTGQLVDSFQTNDLLVLASTNAVPLSTPNVITGMVLVTDTSGLIVYTNGTDYLLGTGAPGITTIQRTDTSAIPDGATVSVTYNVSTVLGPSGLNLTIAGDALIEQGGAIAVSGLGYNSGHGPGHGASAGSPLAGGGGGYGGSGGSSASNAVGGSVYGLLLQPTDKGSEGGSGPVGLGGSGGGAVKLSVGGLLRVSGSISANGASATNERAGGGAGGSIWLSAQTFAGSGNISADGGDGEPVQGGGGGGGRIAIYYQTNTFAGALSAHGGRGAQNGGAGTVYTKLGQAVGSAIADNGGRTGATTPLSTTEALALTVKGGAMMSLPAPLTVGSLLLASNGWVTVGRSPLTVTGDATIQPGSGITADAAGYLAGAGPGAGRSSSSSGYLRGSGAGYGGAGAGVAADALGGGCYGFVHQPTDFGSGGGNGGGTSPYNLGGAGGGALLLNVNGTLTLGGTISANGGAGVGQGSGGGSGGSLWLNVGALAGAGTLSACGGLGNDVGGSGGGGRIAVYYQNSSFTGTMKAWGAGSGVNYAGAGTIYTKVAGQSVGQLLVDNGGPTAVAVSAFSATEALGLTIQGGATACLLTSQTLGSLLINFNGWMRLTNLNFTISGDAVVNAGGGIVADGTGPANGSGSGGGRNFPISPTGGPSYGGGGGYGGYGGFGGYSLGGATYGTTSQATQGSGGGSGGGTNYGGAGGGLVSLTVNGTLTLNGRLSAEGIGGFGINYGGGSGGGIALTVGTLSGAGLISANGGPGNGFGGGGGGGRIALNYTTSYFMGTIRAWGGPGASNGGAGTIYSKGSAQSFAQVTLDNGGTIGNGSDPNSSGTVDLILRGSATVSNYNIYFPTINNLTIASNSWLLYAYPGTASLIVGGNATIQAGGGIRADGAGQAGGSGQGAGRSGTSGSVTAGSGGAYGGYGAPVGSILGGTGYGLAIASPTAGSGGGNGSGSLTGGSGGGSLSLRVTGILVLDGRLSADGNPAVPGYNGGGGSGGSIYLTTAALMGAGTISAGGGAGDGLGGGGGGGRIMLLATVNTFLGTATAYGGNGASRGGAGTVYTSVSQSTGQIVADNGGLPGTNTFLQDTGTFDLAVKGAAILYPSYFSVSIRDLFVGSNSWLLVSGISYADAGTFTVSGNAVIDTGGGIRADGTGYPAGSGQGAGRTYIFGTTNVGSGGGYGGYGGVGGIPGALGGVGYGSASTSASTGSGGGSAASFNYGGAGGGGVVLHVTGSLTVDGKITANGASAAGANAGGGAGGGIYITAAALFGSGTITANGGTGLGLGGGGGGGRIMLLPTANVFSGLVTAYGGAGFSRGGAGTIFTSPGQGVGLILADNGGVSGTNTFLGDSGSFDLTVKGAAKAYIISTSFSPRDLYVAANSWLILPASTATVNVTGNAVFEAGGGILADGLGYGAGAGPGPGTVYGGIHGGGGYGGYGGGAVAETGSGGGISYGSIQTPNQWGSGGAYVQGASGGAGGGAVMLNITGTLDLEGLISANGNPGGQNSGGGAGGTVSLTVGTILGSGAISANGGNGTALGGGGGGGRIALVYGANLFNGTLTAYGGTGYVTGGAGTIYTSPKSAGASHAQVVVDNGGRAGENTQLSSAGSSTDITIKNGGIAWASPGSSVHNLLVLSNGWVSFHGSTYNPPLNVTGNATIQAGGGLVAEGPGAGAGSYPGGGGRSVTSVSGTAGGGGAHGGSGASSLTGGAGGAAYDSPTAPANAGSSGGNGPDSVLGGYGGGVVVLNVTGTLQLDGRISANGTGGMSPGGGGGSGGTVSLSVGRLAGAGSISANGGNGDGLGGGGGGGRILVRYNTSSFAGLLTTFGGGGGAAGGAGTIYTRPNSGSSGLLLVDNAGQSGTNTPFSYTSVVDLTVQNGAVLSLTSPYASWSNLVVNAGGTLTTVSGQTSADLTVLHNARIESGGTVSLDGKGFRQATGPGAGLTASFIGSGAGYGGNGGASSMSPGGATYGSAQQPVDLGSGGGLGWGVPSPGSEGGGALRLTVAGSITVNGRLSANGNAGLQDDAGGGSGGSVWVEAGSFTGSGAVSADGGPGELFEGGGGGGGRIAVYSRTNTFTGQVTVAGAPGYFNGQDGTVYFSSALASPAVVAQTPDGIVSNGVSTVDLFFNTAINPDPLNIANLGFASPTGPVFASLAVIGSTHLQLVFPLQTTPGAYTLTVGPNLQDLFGQPMSQVYTGSFTISMPVIQGIVTNLDGTPVAGLLMQPSGGWPSSVTDTNGNYIIGVPTGSDVTVTPVLDGLVLVPASRSYTNVTASISNQNYLAVLTLVPTMMASSGPSGITASWFGIPGVTYQVLSSTNLADWVLSGDALVGTNGPAQFVMPTGPDPIKFFRVRASN